MPDKRYFKRLDYTKRDIASAPFSNMTFFGEKNAAVYLPVEDFLKTVSSEANTYLFDFSKTDREKNCGLGSLYIDEVKEKRNSGFYLNIKPREDGQKVSVFINFKLDAENSVLYDQNFINIEDNAYLKLVVYYGCKSGIKGMTETEPFRNGLFSIKTGKNSMLELIKVQNFCDEAINFETLKIDVGENANILFYDVQLGAKTNGVSSSIYMRNPSASVNVFPLYFIDQERNMDIEHNLIVNGKNSVAKIKARGAVKDSAKKMFRGNIFLNKGCGGASAAFSDNNIMLDKKICAVTVPTIFCDEDDVIGEHAASFEAVNPDELFYLMSRGFDDLSAKKLIIDSYFTPVFDMIENTEIRESLIEGFNSRLNGIADNENC